MFLKMKNVRSNIFLIVIGLLFAGFIIKDFSYNRNVEKSYYGALCAEENGRLRELESVNIRMTGTLTNSNQHGRRIVGEFDFDLRGRTMQVPFVTHASSYDRELKWYIGLLTFNGPDFGPLEIDGYTSRTLCFAKNLSALGMLLESNGNHFFLIAAEKEDELSNVETAVLAVIQDTEPAAICIGEWSNGEYTSYVEGEVESEKNESTAPATWVASVDEEILPPITRASNLILEESLSDVETSRGSGSTYFKITRSQPYFRVSIKNNGTETLHASMCFGDKNADSFWDYDIGSGEASTKVWTANEFGRFYINFTSNPHGLNLDGKVSVRVSSNHSDLE